MDISLTELENAINEWRARRPSTGEERALSPEVNALASIYALMIYHHRSSIPLDSCNAYARELLQEWLAKQGSSRQ